MKNPFEEKRKNDRINRLVKENERLSVELEIANGDLKYLRMNSNVWESIAETNKSLQAEIDNLKSELDRKFSEGYNQAVWDVTQFLTGKQKEN